MKFNSAIRKGIRYVEDNKFIYLDKGATNGKPFCGCALADAICGADETLDLAEKFMDGDHPYWRDDRDKILANLMLDAGVVGVASPVTREEMPELVRDAFSGMWTPAYRVVDVLHQRGWSPTRIADWLRSIGL